MKRMSEKEELGEKEGKQERGGGRKEGVVRKRVEREGNGGGWRRKEIKSGCGETASLRCSPLLINV